MGIIGKLIEKRRIKKEQERLREQEKLLRQEEERRKHDKTLKEISDLLDKFRMDDLKKLCQYYLGMFPNPDVDEFGNRYKLDRRKFINFIFQNIESNELKFQQIKDFALQENIVVPSFFGFETSKEEYQREFEGIINAIKSNFVPEKISDEEHLEAQIAIFLKAKFPDKKIMRQVKTKFGDELDILIDDKYALELKVPTTRTVLRNLSAQLEEYKEQYPFVCAYIFENQELNLSNVITEYADKFKRDFGVPSIIFKGEKRGETSNNIQ